jgi:hypothetical protein
MSLTYLGNVSIGATIPGVNASLVIAMQDLEARIAALAAFNPGSVDFNVSLQLALDIVSNLQASLGLTPPSISLQISLVLQLLGLLKLQLQVLLQLKDALVVAGVDAYSYAGRVDQLGPELATELATGLPSGAPGSAASNALVLITSIGSTWTAMGQVFLV